MIQFDWAAKKVEAFFDRFEFDIQAHFIYRQCKSLYYIKLDMYSKIDCVSTTQIGFEINTDIKQVTEKN